MTTAAIFRPEEATSVEAELQEAGNMGDMLKRVSVLTALIALICAAAIRPTHAADQVVYQFAALRGGVDQCQWFDDNLNDRSEGALVRQADALYNRVALPPEAPVNVTQNATAASGSPLLGFTLGGSTLCAGAGAIRPTPAPSPSS
jgi:hypothetical protein